MAGPIILLGLLALLVSSSPAVGQDRGFLGTSRSRPARPLEPQLKVGKTSPKSKAHKKRYRTRGTQPPKISAGRKRDARNLYSPREEGARANRYAGAGIGSPAPRKGVRDNRRFLPTSPKVETDNKKFGRFVSSGPEPRKGVKDRRKYFPTTRPSKEDNKHFGRFASAGPRPGKAVRDSRKYFPNSPQTKPDTKHFGRFASSGPAPRKGVRDNRKYFPTSPRTRPDTKHFGRFASSGPTERNRVRDTRKYFPTTPRTKPDTKHFGKFASSGPTLRKGVPDNRKYFPTTPTIKFGRKHYGQYAQKGPAPRRSIRDDRPRKIAGLYSRTPSKDGAAFNKQRYVANFHGFDSPGALWRGDLKGKQKPKGADYQKRGFLDGAYFNTPLPPKGAGRIAGLSANYQGNMTTRPTTGRYAKMIAGYQGNLTTRPGTGKYARQMANYTGHQGDMRRYRIRMTRELATYAGGERVFKRSTGINISGLLSFKRANKVYPRKDIAKYGGRVPRTTPSPKESGAYSQGNVLVKDQYRKTWFQSSRESLSFYFSNFKFGLKSSPSKQMARSGGRASSYYIGKYKLSRPVKGAHPTAIYARNTFKHGSVQRKESNRKMNLWINRLFVFKGKDQPDDFKKPVGKPKYDKKEHQIWND